jgi:hypothetical protein
MIGFCSRKLGGSALQAHDLLDMEKEGPAYDLFKAKIEVLFSLLPKNTSWMSGRK